ncbi:MAG: T9SS type A sorting domain-containing protein, partial [Bacteroidales bacterium]|nr:T9SS type A sorting domain-containing protein [Bacteroidales bacterium]
GTTYQIQVQANCGDGNLSDWSPAINVTTTGIENRLESSVNLYPNPAKEYVDIRVDGDLNVTIMEVYDVYGKLINTVNVIDNPTRINVSSLANGMYFVRVTTEKGMVTKTFVKR